MNDTKSLKQYAKEAKLRLKSSFWQDYKSKVEDEYREEPKRFFSVFFFYIVPWCNLQLAEV